MLCSLNCETPLKAKIPNPKYHDSSKKATISSCTDYFSDTGFHNSESISVAFKNLLAHVFKTYITVEGYVKQPKYL